jgi:2-polyprenyl-3-methyl-5-hydroxy-6-metoxy-1,4-benzoquinol methylase
MEENIMPHNHEVFPAWRSWVLDNVFRKLYHNPKKILQGLIKPGDTAADIGCGPGFFTITMAHMAGQGGTVMACDLQDEMLGKVRKKAEKQEIRNIVYIKSEKDKVNISGKLDFALCFYIVHEVPDSLAFFKEIAEHMKKGGKVLFAEPGFAVDDAEFNTSIENAKKAGFEVTEQQKIPGSKAVLLQFGK